MYGMKVMSDGIQQASGERLQRALNFMTGNRFIGVLSGLVITFLIHSSAAVSVMVVSFVNAGLLTVKQSIGVIMGTNIGTTLTAWMVSLLGFGIDISSFALPAVGIGFIMRAVKWRYRDFGSAIMGFGFLFLGLNFLTTSLPEITPEAVSFIADLSGRGALSVLIGVGAGAVVTLMMNSSTATTILIITLASKGVINFEMSAAMILGANIGTTVSAPIAAIGAKPAAKQTALVHVLFNVIGALIVIIFFKPFIWLVDHIIPGDVDTAALLLGNEKARAMIAFHLTMFHTAFNLVTTLVLLPFVKQFAALVSWLVKDRRDVSGENVPYKLEYQSNILQDTPELNIIRAEKEIRDMAGLVSSMYAAFSSGLQSLKKTGDKEEAVTFLVENMKRKEEYADQMREALTAFLMECTREQLNSRSEQWVSQLLRIIADLEDMTDDCYSVGLLLERSVKKNQIFREKEMNALSPYMNLVEDFLVLLRECLGQNLTEEQIGRARDLESEIDKSRNKLRRLGRKRIEAGVDVKTELLFIDLVRRIEKLGDYCYDIAEALSKR